MSFPPLLDGVAPPLFHRQLPAAYPCPHIGRPKPPKCSPAAEQEMSSCEQQSLALLWLTLIIPFPNAGWDIAAQIGIALLNFRSGDPIPKALTPVPIQPALGNTTGRPFLVLSKDLFSPQEIFFPLKRFFFPSRVFFPLKRFVILNQYKYHIPWLTPQMLEIW